MLALLGDYLRDAIVLDELPEGNLAETIVSEGLHWLVGK